MYTYICVSLCIMKGQIGFIFWNLCSLSSWTCPWSFTGAIPEGPLVPFIDLGAGPMAVSLEVWGPATMVCQASNLSNVSRATPTHFACRHCSQKDRSKILSKSWWKMMINDFPDFSYPFCLGYSQFASPLSPTGGRWSATWWCLGRFSPTALQPTGDVGGEDEGTTHRRDAGMAGWPGWPLLVMGNFSAQEAERCKLPRFLQLITPVSGFPCDLHIDITQD